MVHGYLRDVGGQINRLQRGVNEIEELVALDAEPPGVADRPGARPRPAPAPPGSGPGRRHRRPVAETAVLPSSVSWPSPAMAYREMVPDPVFTANR